MKSRSHYGVYGLVIENNKILFVDKVGGPYDGKLDLPGGGPKEGESKEETLRREFLEETGLIVEDFTLYDEDTVVFDFEYEGKMIRHSHKGTYYIINKYNGTVQNKVELDQYNNDSLGAKFYNISELKEENLSKIAIMELKKLGYLSKNKYVK